MLIKTRVVEENTTDGIAHSRLSSNLKDTWPFSALVLVLPAVAAAASSVAQKLLQLQFAVAQLCAWQEERQPHAPPPHGATGRRYQAANQPYPQLQRHSPQPKTAVALCQHWFWLQLRPQQHLLRKLGPVVQLSRGHHPERTLWTPTAAGHKV